MSRRFFKYLRREHAQALVQRGEVRVATLLEFRKTEALGEEIGDRTEGTQVAYSHEPLVDFDKPEAVTPFVKKFVRANPGVGARFINIRFEEQREASDVFVFCASIHYSREAMTRMGYDTCVVVEDVENFAKGMMHALHGIHPLEEMFVGEVVYQERSQHYTKASVSPVFVKEPGFAYQDEVRVVLVPRALPIQTEILVCPTLSALCRLYEPGN